jgi:hypothetical protein
MITAAKSNTKNRKTNGDEMCKIFANTFSRLILFELLSFLKMISLSAMASHLCLNIVDSYHPHHAAKAMNER